MKHLIFIVNGGGARKKDYYENPSLAPNIRRIANEAFVFEEDHCEQIASHDAAFNELIAGAPIIRDAPRVQSIEMVPQTMRESRPRVLICRENSHDAGHERIDAYFRAIRHTDAAIGRVFDWVKSDPYFYGNTSIVIRPEFGRDDEVNAQGQLHHSYGFYYTHRVASILWGPDFKPGVDRTSVIRSADMPATLSALV